MENKLDPGYVAQNAVEVRDALTNALYEER